MEKKHFVFINNQGLSDFGGGVTILKQLVNKCAEKNDVTVISETEPVDLLVNNITQLTIPRAPSSGMGLWRLKPILKALFLKSQLKKILPVEYDCLIVLDCHYALSLNYFSHVNKTIIYLSLSCIPRQEWFSGTGGFFQRGFYFLQYAFLERKIIQLSDKVFVSSRGHKREISYYELLKKFSPIVLEPVFKPNKLSINSSSLKKGDKTVITTLCRLEKVKNIDVVIDLAGLLSKQNCCFRIVGDGPEKHYLEQLILDRGLEKEVVLLGESNDIYQELLGTDILFHPSHYESFGMVIFEAMCMAVPVVISDNSESGLLGISEYIENKKNGYCIEMNNLNEVANVMKQLINSASLRHKIGHAGNEVAEHLLDKDYVTSFYKILDDYDNREE